MPEKVRGGKKKIPLRVIGLRILIFVALVAATALVLRPLQLRLRNQMEKIRDSFLTQAEEFLNRKIEYGSIGPSIFGTLDIRNVLILREDKSVLLSVSRVRLSYSLVKLLRGDIQEAFHSVRIDRPVLNLDFEKDKDLGERFAAYREQRRSAQVPGGTKSFRDLLPENFSFRIWNGEWEVSGTGGNLKISGVGLDASVVQSRVNFQGRWDASGSLAAEKTPAFFFTSKDPSPLLEAVMTGQISGEYTDETEEGSATVTIPSFYGDYFKLKPLTLSFFLSDRHLEIRKTHDKSPAAISVVYDLDDGGLRGRFESENFSPEDLFSFSGSWKDYNPALAFRISGNADLERKSSGVLSYNMNFSGALPGNVFPGPASLAILVSGDNDHVNINTLNVRSSYGDVNFRGGVDFMPTGSNPFIPYGSLSLSNFRLRGNKGISGDLNLSTDGREINVSGKNFTSGNTVIPELDLSLYQEDQGLSFSFSADDTRAGNIFIEGSMDYGSMPQDRRIQASVKLDSFSIENLLSFAEPLASLPALPPLVRSAAEDLSVTTEVFFTTDYENILYNAPSFVASYNGLENIQVAASLSGTNKRFELSEGNISWKGESSEISCSVDFSDPDDISFSFGAVYKDLTYFLDGMFLDQQNITIRGSYGFQAYLFADNNGAYSGYVQGDDIPLPAADHYASLSLLVSLFYVSPTFWHADIQKFEIDGMKTPASSAASLHFTGAANDRGLNIPDLFFDDGKGALGGSVSLNWDTYYSNYRFKADIVGASGNEYYGLFGTYIDNKLELNLSGLGMQFSRFSTQNAVADASLRLSWESPASFDAETVLSSLVLYQQDNEIRASAEATINNDMVLVKDLKVNYSGLEASVPYFRLSRAEAHAETEAFIQGNLSGKSVDLSLRGEAQFNSAETWLDLFRRFDSLDGSLRVDTARYDTIRAEEPFSFLFSGLREKEAFTFNLTGGPRNMVRFLYTSGDSGGNFYAALSSPSPVRGSFTGLINSTRIDAQGTDVYVDLGSLWRFIPPNDAIAFPDGIVTASVRIVGPLKDPEFYGTARGTSLQILVPQYLPEPIRPVPTAIVLNGSEMSFGPTDAFVGQGGGKVTGSFRFERWIPNNFSIDIQVPPETSIPYAFDIAGVIAGGLVGGRLVVSMEDKVLFVNGDLTATNTEISLNANEMAAMAIEAKRPYQYDDKKPSSVIDINIHSGRRLEFFWPSADFPVLQANADMGSKIRVTSDSASKRFTLTGDVNLRSGEIFYLERNFYIREGTLFFKETEADFDPRISARAEIRDQSETGPVTISLIIDNAPLRSFTPRFISTPPLSQMEIYALLGQQNPQGGAGGAGQQRNLATSVAFDTLTQFTVIRRLQRQIRDFLGLDMLSLRTQVLQNVVLQAAGANQVQDPAGDRPYRVGNYFDNSTVFIGKYFGSAMFGQAMLSFKYDENKVTWGGLKLEPEVGLEMRNPLFDIHVNLVPLHPENWFMDDISFSLIWRRSF